MNPWLYLAILAGGFFFVMVLLPIYVVMFGRMVRFVWRGWEKKPDD